MEPKVSVIIPVLNRRDLIGKTLESVSSQSWRPLEIVVVDNGSRDGTYEVVEGYAARNNDKELHIELIRHPDPGASKARNAGFRHSTGEIIAFFDSDDIMAAGSIAEYVAAFKADPEADMVVAGAATVMEDGRVVKRGKRRGDAIVTHFHHCTLNTVVYASRKRFLSRVEEVHGELWPDYLGVWDDWALGMRLLLMKPRIAVIDHVAALIRHQTESITGDAYCLTCAERYLAAIADVRNTASLHLRERPRLGKKGFSRLRNLTLYRRVMLAGLLSREARKLPESVIVSGPYASASELAQESRRILADALREAPSARVRMVLLFAYRYVASGMRGCATLVTPFL